MNGFWRHLRQSKLVQWALAYTAGAFAILQGVDIVAQRFAWPGVIERVLIIAIFVGFFVTLLLAWYHGERGEQRVTGSELLLLAVLLAAGSAFLWMYGRTPRAASATARTTPAVIAAPGSIPARSIAVLPFENLSADKNNAYFADGMQDLILTKLAEIGDLKVISRSSADKYASRPSDLKTVGLELGVATLLEGSVQKVGRQVLVNVQLIDARTDTHIWADSYQRTLDNVFGVEGEVAQKIATSLNAKLSQQESRRLASGLTDDTATNDLFLRAEYYQRHVSATSNENFLKAIQLYHQALARKPGFTLARAQLSRTESWLIFSNGGGDKIRHYRKDACVQARRAVTEDPALAEAHLALGECLGMLHEDFAGAIQAFSAALKIRPNDAETLEDLGTALDRKGKVDASVGVLRRAFELDPRSSMNAARLGREYLMAQRYPEAKQTFRHALALDPGNVGAKFYYAFTIALGSGDIERALAVVQGNAPTLRSARVRLLIYQRKYRQALHELAKLQHYANYAVGTKLFRRAELERMMGDASRARATYAKAMPQLRKQLRAATLSGIASKQAFVWNNIARADFGTGQTQAGLKAMDRALRFHAQSPDKFFGAWLLMRATATYAQARRPDLAVPLLSQLLSIRGGYSPRMLWVDSHLDPIRKDPAFKALEKKYAKYRPASAPAHSKG